MRRGEGVELACTRPNFQGWPNPSKFERSCISRQRSTAKEFGPALRTTQLL